MKGLVLLVGYTYQDFLKYEKFLQNQKMMKESADCESHSKLGLDKNKYDEEEDLIMYTVREFLAENDQRIRKDAITQGIAQGITQNNKTVAKKMLSLGLSSDLISKVTGLSTEEIEKIKQS